MESDLVHIRTVHKNCLATKLVTLFVCFALLDYLTCKADLIVAVDFTYHIHLHIYYNHFN